MQVHSIISNTISEDILETGHLSIRFTADGFSLLLENSQYRPILLNKFSDDEDRTIKELTAECEDWLERNSILENFNGEVSLVFDSASATIIPKEIFIPEHASTYLDQLSKLRDSASVDYRRVKNRPFYIVYAIPNAINSLAKIFNTAARIIHSTEVIFSVADQVNASDHQRGFAYVDVQNKGMSLLIISDDKLEFMNQLKLTDSREYVYHSLNIIKQVAFDRRKSPLYYSGICKEINGTLDSLTKYIKNVSQLSYFMHDIKKEAIAEHILLAEATRCE